MAAEYLRPYWRGHGCPSGEHLSVVTAPNAGAVSVLFNKMEVNNREGAPVRLRTKCVLSIPLRLNADEQVIVERVDYRGFYDLGVNTRLTLNSSFFFEGGIAVYKPATGRPQYNPGPMYPGGIAETIVKPQTQDFFWTANIPTLTMASSCGGSSILHIVSVLHLKGDGKGSGTFDTADGVSQVYRFRVGKCEYRQKVVNYPRHLLDRALDPELDSF